jgi:hypothetical protein
MAALEEFDFADGLVRFAANVIQREPSAAIQARAQEAYMRPLCHDWLVGHPFSQAELKPSAH